MKLDTAEFLEVFERIASIGATPDGGCERLSMSPEDIEARALLTGLLEEEALRSGGSRPARSGRVSRGRTPRSRRFWSDRTSTPSATPESTTACSG